MKDSGKTCLLAMGALVFLCALGLVAGQVMAIFGEEENSPSPATSRTPRPEDTPTPDLPPDERLFAALKKNARVRQAGWSPEQAGELFVQWALESGWNDAATGRQARREATGFLEAIAGSGLDYTGTRLSGWLPLVDVYGNEKNTEVIAAYYTQETLQKVKWANFESDNVWRIMDGGEIHPALR